jgi:hypothetical protein
LALFDQTPQLKLNLSNQPILRVDTQKTCSFLQGNHNGINYVVMVNNGKAIDSTAVDTSTIYLRAHAKYGTSRTSFAYSLDNQSFKKLGNELVMQFNLSIFTGNKFCLFNYAAISTGGFVDFDWFRTGFPKPN